MTEGIVPVIKSTVESFADDEEAVAACAKSQSLSNQHIEQFIIASYIGFMFVFEL